jgi:hypothetical protein
LIQKIHFSDSIVAHFCSQATPRRLLQQNRHEAGGYCSAAFLPLLNEVQTELAQVRTGGL